MEIQNQQNKNLQQIQTQTQMQTQIQIQNKNISENINVADKEFETALYNLKQSFKDPEIRGVYERLKDK